MYNICMMTGVFVTAITQRKRVEWECMIKTDQIPVTCACPSLTPAGNLAYTLDKTRLHWMQVQILARHLARREGFSVAYALALIDAGLPIPAADVALVKEIEQDASRYPAFRLWYTRPLSTAAVFC